jgi:hypothetical protein
MNELNLNFEPNPKQDLAWEYLHDNVTTEILFGGGAGGGKSYLGCIWILKNCFSYPETRWMIGRSVLKSLKESTLNTMFGIFRDANLKKDIHFKYNEIAGTITFKNGSQIYLKDLFQNPSDPEFDVLGSTEFTGAFIDEVSQIVFKAKEIVKSRLRFKLDQYSLIPKLLMTTNPTKGWVYEDYYRPDKENKLKHYQKFIQCLVSDNPKVSKHYIATLEQLNDGSRERLLFGNWDFDDDPAIMIPYNKIIDIFDTVLVNDSDNNNNNKYIIVDVARFGKDSTVISVWTGLNLIKIERIPKSDLVFVYKRIEALRGEFKISITNVVVDEDGVGGGVVDMGSYKGFVANSSVIDIRSHKEKTDNVPKPNYNNLKSQCAFTIAQHINDGLVSITCDIEPDIKSAIIADLSSFKTHNQDKDGKNCFIPKDKQKLILGRSPDYGDIFIMRALLLLDQPFDIDHFLYL